jgi:hypothetical protein
MLVLDNHCMPDSVEKANGDLFSRLSLIEFDLLGGMAYSGVNALNASINMHILLSSRLRLLNNLALVRCCKDSCHEIL